MSLQPLPIDRYLPQVVQNIAGNRSTVVVASPGAGKTTRIPPAILAANILDAKHPNLVMLQPRRVAARAAAERIADENGWHLGHEVGYHVRFERVFNRQTRLRVVTEGILTRQLLDDPFLDGVGAVILDEFHERNLNSDLAIGLLREVRESVRRDLIIVVMSATLNPEPLAKFLGDCPIVRADERMFEVKIDYRPAGGSALPEHTAAVVESVLSHPAEQSGDVLVFLPGAREIRRTQELLSSASALVLPLHGSLPFEQQMAALRPAKQRRVMLATNIAETSLTIPGVRTVIDGGLARIPFFDPQRGLDHLETKRISKASADQRAGRAGRTATGVCLRLWTAKEQVELDDFELPEVRRVDLSPTVLALHVWGQDDARHFGWFEAPDENSLAGAERLLATLGAIVNGKITELGRRMQALPIHPRLARLLIAAAGQGLIAEGAALAALISEIDLAPEPPPNSHGSSDLLVRLDLSPSFEMRRLTQELTRLVPTKGHAKRADESALLKLALLAYPDRVARRRSADPSTATMVGGRGVRLAWQSVVKTAEFFICVDARGDDRAAARQATVHLASAIDPAWLEEMFPQSITRQSGVEFDKSTGRVVGRTLTMYLDLTLSQERDSRVDPAQAAEVLTQALLPQLEKMFAEDESATAFLARVDLLKQSLPEEPWPTFDEPAMRQALEQACLGKQSVDELKRQSLATFLEAQLPPKLARLLDQQAPLTIALPNGKRAKITYQRGKPPILAARLAEFIGWTQTPRIANGRVPLLLHILGPNYRPVQVTDNLASFWKNTYPQVRKDLRRRYPKHAWPEDPLTGR
jgi:ATP-dependent helicase HrpB